MTIDKVTSAKGPNDSSDSGKIIENAAKLVEGLAKAGPAIASLGASIVALGFASYIVSQSPKEEENAKGDTKQTTQPVTK